MSTGDLLMIVPDLTYLACLCEVSGLIPILAFGVIFLRDWIRTRIPIADPAPHHCMQDYLLVNGERTALCGSLTAPRTMLFPATVAESIFLYTDSIFLDKVGAAVE